MQRQWYGFSRKCKVNYKGNAKHFPEKYKANCKGNAQDFPENTQQNTKEMLRIVREIQNKIQRKGQVF